MAHDPQITAYLQIRINICLQMVFCLEGQRALSHLPQRFCITIQGKMYEKKTVDQHVLSSLLLYSSEATHPLCNHKNSNRKVPKPFCSLPARPIFRRVWTEIKTFYFPHQHLNVLCNIKEPQEERKEELQTSWNIDLFLGSCLGLKPRQRILHHKDICLT